MFIANPFINIRNFIQDKSGNWVPKKEPTLKMAFSDNGSNGLLDKVAGTDLVVFNISGKKIILDTFEFTINGSGVNTYPALHLDGSTITSKFSGQLLFTLNSTNGGSRSVATPTRIAGDGSSYFDIMEYDAAANEYKFGLKAPIELPQGGRLSFQNLSTYESGDKVQYKAVYRVWE